MGNNVLPHGESLRRAVRWLSDQGRHDPATVEEAARRFDLTPAEEEFLLSYFTVRTPRRGEPPEED